MSATSPATNVTAPVVYRSPWQRWKDFWFHPSDPTTLGFIRIMTGLLVLYIHLAYSLDLQAFFGPHGWYAGRFIERERHESPNIVQPLNDQWGDPPPVFAQLSDFPHRRTALMQYLDRCRPIPPFAKPAYLNRVSGFRNRSDAGRGRIHPSDRLTRLGTGTVYNRADWRDGLRSRNRNPWSSV